MEMKMIMIQNLNKNLMINQKPRKKLMLKKKKLIWQHQEFKKPTDTKKINLKERNYQKN